MKTYQKYSEKVILKEIEDYCEPFLHAVKTGNTLPYLPSIEHFALAYGYSVDTIYHWRNEKSAMFKGDTFQQATERIRNLRYVTLVDNATLKKFDSSFTKYRLGFEFKEWDIQKVESANLNVNAPVTDEEMDKIMKEKNVDDRVRKKLQKNKVANTK